MRLLLLFSIMFSFFFNRSYAQCGSLPIDYSNYSVFFSSGFQGGQADSLAIDGDSNTFWQTPGNQSFPQEIQLDMEAFYAINQVQITPRQGSTAGKLAGYEVYLSNDGQNWGNPEAASQLLWNSPDDNEPKFIDFGAIDSRYLRLVATSNYDTGNPNRLFIAEITIGMDTCGATGQKNQIITFPSIQKQQTSSGTFVLEASASSGLPVSYTILSGPATVSGDTLIYTGEEGQIIVQATQAGDASWYPSKAIRAFNVIDPSNYKPVIRTRLTSEWNLEMPELLPYELSASASIAHADLFQIESLRFEVNGIPLPGNYQNGVAKSWWIPSSYGQHTVNIIATASNGVTTTEEFQIMVVNPAGDDFSVKTIDGETILFGGTNSRWFYGTYTLPQHVGAYEILAGELWVSCPDIPEGCDDWDRKAYIEVKAPNGEWIEIIRYITPYGVGCTHTIDLTDYSSLLQGEIDFRVFIDTWGTGGWDVHLRLDYVAGSPEYNYMDVNRIWRGNYPFGDPANLQPMPTRKLAIGDLVETAKLKLTTTGHGWGENNYFNAAEFYQAVHHLHIDDEPTFTQELWTQCEPNPDGCTGQLGTWYFPRAGWCPGAVAELFEYNFTPWIGADTFELDYVFDIYYEDKCHPNAPDCVSGVTCPNCNDGYNPQYEISANLISYYDYPEVILSQDNLHTGQAAFSIEPNPANNLAHLKREKNDLSARLEIFNAGGKLMKTVLLKGTNNDPELIDLKDWSAGIYILRLTQGKDTAVQKLIKQ